MPGLRTCEKTAQETVRISAEGEVEFGDHMGVEPFDCESTVGAPLFSIPSFAIFNNIVLFALYALVLYILGAILSAASSACGTSPYPTSGSSGMSRVYSNARPSRRPVARVGPNKVVFKDASSAKNADSVHRFGKITRRSRGTIKTMRAEELLAAAIGDFSKRRILRSVVPTWAWSLVYRVPNVHCRLLCDSDKIMAEFVSARAKSSASESMPDRNIISEVMAHMVAATDTTTISLLYFLQEMSRRQATVAQL
ncbi:hypothetical protein FIBSPDRAFT_1040318 [Athelia psychrophila]|uniref:Cytochrome P450 n=1 Tax=Athelia psychrophila TaxID=1759441 RepID=A0A166QGT7_9AGAM|nr:hypothetical protein FIBSPDRAFT_1040318 [Fibularhizoctonia sp. CBS 109695]